MENMIDIHNHILYGVDDGSDSFEQSKKMLKIAYDEGIRSIILTPHHNPYRWQNEPIVLNDRYRQIKEYAGSEFKDLEIYLGSEIYYGSDSLEELENKTAFTMAGGRYILIEFSPFTEYRKIKAAVMDSQQSGYYPILAHVERYECLLEDFENLEKLKDYGAFIQINASSVIKERSRAEKKFIRTLLKNEMADFVATDAHSDNHRAPLMKKCAAFIMKHCGEEYAYHLFISNPRSVINDIYIEE